MRPRLPVTKAMFLHKLKPTEDDYTMGDVLALAFLPNNDIVVLTSEGRKVIRPLVKKEKQRKSITKFNEEGKCSRIFFVVFSVKFHGNLANPVKLVFLYYL